MRRVTTTRTTTSRSRTNPVMLLSRRRWRWRCLRVAGNDGTGGRVDETEEGDKRERDMTCGPGRSGRGKGVTGRAGHRRRRRLTLDRAGTGCNGARCAPGNLKCRAGDQVCRTQVLREGGTARKVRGIRCLTCRPRQERQKVEMNVMRLSSSISVGKFDAHPEGGQVINTHTRRCYPQVTW